MNKKSLTVMFLAGGLLALSPLLGSRPAQDAQEFSDQAETGRLRKLAGETLKIPVENAEFRSEPNFVGFRSKEYLFSRRLDSRTYFVQDLRPVRPGETQLYRGTEAEYLSRLREVFKGFDLPAEEITQAKVLEEQTQEGRVNHETGKVEAGERHAGRRWATAARQVEGLPVFSSRVMLGLAADGRVDYLELHWPAIPAETLAEAHYLAAKSRERWQPPAVAGAHVESVEAGVIHSPAVGFAMDFYPAIRVIYAPDAKGHSKKAVRYFDRIGRDVPIPRQFATTPEDVRGTEKPLRQPRKE